ncbi:Ig-like domain-containing protein [Nocardioides sp. QY071]|uniref:Ig-like domain-containing protein n=1 Tax=Nocardioides sp. QY071 TaxID=3044187 RepID=UPI00249A6D79|nr:Ig-like domain-containing protein [Nocardioides sp. QY071]WGY03957.1 Ig-like domain-containing protein [Nocardioides sp. QY071]
MARHAVAATSWVGTGLLLVVSAFPATAVAPGIPARSSCTIAGTPGPDVLVGTSGRDVICGLGGNDRISGGGGDDAISGGPGDDVIDGGAGDDLVWGSSGDDVLRGGGGADRLFGGAGDDTLRGAAGDDQLHGGPGGDVLRGGPGADALYGGRGDDRLDGGPGADDLGCGRGADTAVGSPDDDLGRSCDDDATPPVTPEPPNAPGAPVAVDDTVVTDEDTVLELPVSGAGSPVANDTDPDGDPLSVTSVAGPVGGAVVLTGGVIRFTPLADLCGTGAGRFDYTVGDGTGRTDAGRVTVDITCQPDDPTAVDDVTTVGEDAAATTVDVLGNDADIDGDPLAIASVTQPGDGTVVITGGGTGLTYQPDADFCTDPPGTTPDTFTYTLTPGGATATVSVQVTCVDDPPVAVADSDTVSEDASASAVDVLANDTDTDGGPRSIVSVTQPGHGTVAITGGGAGLTYRPAADYCTTGAGGSADTFTYTISGGSSASVAMTVTCVDDLPIAVDDSETVLEDAAATPFLVLGNDTDADGDAFTIGSVTQPTNGVVVITGGGTGLTYAPSADYCNSAPGGAADTFTYSLAPGGDSATVTVTVTCVADAATAVADTATVSEDSGATAVSVLANDLNPDGLTLSITSVTQPANGVVVITGGGTGLTYAPTANYCNTQPGGTPDSFTYTITGGTTASVAMTVTCVVDPSVAVDDDVTITEDQAGPLTVMVNDQIGDDSPQIISVTQPADGTTTTNGSTVGYTPHANYCNTQAGGTADTFTYTITGGSTATVAVTVTCVNDAPTVAPLTLSEAAVGNTVLVVDDPTDGVPSAAGPRKTTTADVLSGADDAETPGTVTVVAATVSTTQGGSVTLQADGDFVYTPPAGCIASDGFSYQVTDNDPDGAATGTGTVTIPLSGCVWYVANNGAGDSGTSTEPFDTLAQAQTASGTDQTIYVDAGDGTSTGYAAGITLKTNQRLLGEVEDLVVDGVTLSTGVAGQRPLITASGTDVVTLAAGNTVAGLTLDPSGTSSGIAGAAGDSGGVLRNLRVVDTGTAGTRAGISLVSTTGAFSLQDVVIDNTATSGSGGAAGLQMQGTGAVSVQTADVRTKGGPAVDLTNAAGSTLSFGEVTSTGSTTKGVNLDGLGSGTFSATSGSVSGAQVMAFDVNAGSGAITYPGPITDGTGGTLEVTGRSGGTITLSGSLTDGADAGGGIALSSNTGGTTVLSGAAKTLSTGASTAVSMTSSAGHTLTITGGGLAVTTTTGDGIRAASSGTIAVTGTGNTISSGAGRALWVTSTGIGATGLTFARIDSTGGAGGILLADTGSAGSLTVTGTGGTCTAANTSGCTGGTVSGSTGADSSSSTPDGAGVVLSNTKAPSLTRMWIHDHSNYAIRGSGVSGLTLANSVVNGTNGTTGATPYDDSAILLQNATGAVSVTDTHVSGGVEDGLRVDNTSGSVTLTVDHVTFGANGALTANDALSIITEPGAGAVDATITANTFSSAAGDLLGVDLNGTGTSSLTVTGNTLSNSHPAIATGGGGVSIFQSGTGGNATMDVENNTFRDAVGPGVLIVKRVGIAVQQGLFKNNTIGVSGVANSGSAEGSALKLQQMGGGVSTWSVTGNAIRQYNNFGVEVLAGGGADPESGFVNTTVTGNTVAEPGTTLSTLAIPKNGIHYNIGTQIGDSFTACADVRTNDVAASGFDQAGPASTYDIRVRQRQATTVQLPGYAGAAGDTTAVQTFLVANNPTGGPTAAASSTFPTGAGFVNVASCPAPAVP